MQRWLFKSDPDEYALADLERDAETAWTGVRNAQARQYLRSVKRGDLIMIYHTGDEKAVVGVAKAVSGPRPDPQAKDEKAVCVQIRFTKRFTTPVPLPAIKADPTFAGWLLVTNSRLSVMPVEEILWRRIEQLASK